MKKVLFSFFVGANALRIANSDAAKTKGEIHGQELMQTPSEGTILNAYRDETMQTIFFYFQFMLCFNVFLRNSDGCDWARAACRA